MSNEKVSLQDAGSLDYWMKSSMGKGRLERLAEARAWRAPGGGHRGVCANAKDNRKLMENFKQESYNQV